MSLLVLLLVTAGAAALMWQRRAWLPATGLGLAALLPAWALIRMVPWPIWCLVLAVAGAWLWHRQSGSAAMITRWSGRARRTSGTASTRSIARTASARALRKAKARRVRPSLAELSNRALRTVPPVEYAVELCRTGLQVVWASIEDVVIVVGGPRSGKSGWLAARIIDAPGAAIVTSTRTDLLALCGPIRGNNRGPIHVFNAVGMGRIASTVTFDPLTGCTDPVVAMERAGDMCSAVSKGGSGDREFWDAQARRVLAVMLHAAALGKRPMSHVQAWNSEPERAKREIPVLLAKSPVQAFAQDAAQFLSTNEKTATSITSTVTLALQWLGNPASAAASRPERSLDVEQLLRERGTVFLLGGLEGQAAPLVTAFTGHIAREARRMAAEQPSGRLDPPLGIFLDEAFLICPVPLESWTADMGGRGVTIVAVFQSRAQMIDRYGQAKTAQILSNAGARIVFGGTGDRDDLLTWAALAGDRDEVVISTDHQGRRSRSVRQVPVMAPAQIHALPEGRVLVFRRGLNPVIGTARMAWNRPDVRAHHQPDALDVRLRARAAAARFAITAAARSSLAWVGWQVRRLLACLVRTVNRLVAAVRRPVAPPAAVSPTELILAARARAGVPAELPEGRASMVHPVPRERDR
ncbi:MAG: type IV secretory system conjugative DNA transfer family protein [Pseudonocardia sp.]|nr:type IV secretory system conjugative DNA transfer family protein [Pseudonocardia sp.]